ncbi:MAG TPA: type 4a pilus biogenesis protein PilO [Solirubrobacteraceae bacterium]|jgi:Tfp pilus assembly protein PilO
MTRRDRIVLMVVAVIAVLGAGWVLAVSPERQKAGKISAEVVAAKTQLSTAEGELSNARAAQAQYAAAYSEVVSLGKAVPAEEEVPSLIYQLSQATHRQNVEFASIAAPTTPVGAASPAAAAAAGAAFSEMPFTFIFNGSFFALERLFNKLTQFTERSASGSLQVRGRLLTVQSVKLAPVTTQGTKSAKSQLSGTITATAYRLPAGQGLTGGATATSPAGTSTPAASSTGASSTTAPAIARVTP